jgi:cupin fold WbuC family metalloprotein
MVNWSLSGSDSFYAYLKNKDLSKEQLNDLRKKGEESKTGRARFCLHDNPSSELHLMLIYHDERTIVPIHKHSPFGEHIIVLEGELQIFFFDAKLGLNSSRLITDASYGYASSWTPPNVWHSMKFDKPTLFFEISKGPLNVKNTEFASRL